VNEPFDLSSREPAARAEHTRTKQAVRAAIRALLPAGAKPKSSVVGTRRLGEDKGWEAHARLVYEKARAGQTREITARAEGPTGRQAMKNLLASFVRAGRAAPGPRARPGRAKSDARGASRDLLSRYEAGDHAVWQRLLDEADEVLRHPDRRAEAAAVARALMQRVRQNRDLVRAVLLGSGARLAPEAPPARAEDLEAVVSLGGPLPLALEAFWRVVGGIALVPDPENPYDYGPCSLEQTGIHLLSLDSLWLAGANEVGASLDSYRDAIECAAPDPAGPLDLELSPDYLHKQDISGGAPYAVRLPAADAREALDPTLREERHEASLVGYLRLAFASGGFPLLALASRPRSALEANDRLAFEGVKGSWARAAGRLRARLCRDLLPF
jgi:hypothetical protein